MAYIQHRLTVAGSACGRLFTESNAKRIARAARGIPRLINVLAHKALLVGFGEGAKTIESNHVDAAIADTEDAMKYQYGMVKWSVAAMVIIGSCLAAFYWFKGGVA